MAGRDLGDFKKCVICGEYEYSNIHHCPPLFYVRPDDYDFEDATPVRAKDAETAAKKFIESDYDARRATLIVVDYQEVTEWVFDCKVELVPSCIVEETAKRAIITGEE